MVSKEKRRPPSDSHARAGKPGGRRRTEPGFRPTGTAASRGRSRARSGGGSPPPPAGRTPRTRRRGGRGRRSSGRPAGASEARSREHPARKLGELRKELLDALLRPEVPLRLLDRPARARAGPELVVVGEKPVLLVPPLRERLDLLAARAERRRVLAPHGVTGRRTGRPARFENSSR